MSAIAHCEKNKNNIALLQSNGFGKQIKKMRIVSLFCALALALVVVDAAGCSYERESCPHGQILVECNKAHYYKCVPDARYRRSASVPADEEAYQQCLGLVDPQYAHSCDCTYGRVPASEC
jgi:hypothetical protein